MRFGWMCTGMLLLAACGKSVENTPETAPAPAAETKDESVEAQPISASEIAPVESLDLQSITEYSDEWTLNPDWTGEYPAGFVVYQTGVVAAGRAKPMATMAQDVDCPLEQSANYQIWNRERIETDQVVFLSANKTFPVTMTEDASVEIVSNGEIVALELKAGDQLTYLSYMSEGFAKFLHNGTQIELNESELREISDIGEHELIEEQWARVNCTNGVQAWFLYEEIIKTPGIGRSPLIGFGEAHDISPEEIDFFAEEIGVPIE